VITAPSWDHLLNEATVVFEFEYKGFLCARYSILDTRVGSHEIVQLIPRWRISARQVKTPRRVLFDRCGFGQEGVKFSVMAENYPSLGRHLAYPLIVRRLFAKLKFVFGVVMIFNRERRFSGPDCLREAPAEVAIKIQG